MNNTKFLASLMLVSLSVCNVSFAGTNYTFEQAAPQSANNYYIQPLNYNANQPLRGSVVTVPSGASFGAVLSNALSSETATAGDSVTMHLGKDFYYNNKLIAPAGSTVTGTVVEASKAKRGSAAAMLSMSSFKMMLSPLKR